MKIKNNNWQIKKLNEICDKASSNVSQNKLINESGKYPIYGAGGFIKNISFYHRDKKYISIVKDGAGIGRITLLPAKSSVIGTLQYLIPKENIDIKFLYYILSSFDFSRYRNGATIPHIYFKEYSEESFMIPNKKEQKRVVKILDEVFENISKAKENAEKNLKNSKELFESYLNNIFANPEKDWKKRRFDEVCVLQRGFDLPTHSRNGGVHPLVSSNGITDRIDLWKVKSPGVVTGRSGTIGNIHFIEENYWPLNTTLYIKEFCGNYEKCIYYFLKQFNLGKYSSGAGVPTLNRNNVHGELVWFPKSLSEQKAIVKKLDVLSAETKKLEGIYQQKLADLEELKKSVLKSAFAGEL